MGLPSEFWSSWVGTGFEAAAESTVGSTVGVLVTRDSGMCGFCLVSGPLGLPPVACSVQWHWDKDPFQGLQAYQ